MNRRDFIRKTAVSGTALSGIGFTDPFLRSYAEAADGRDSTYPLVGVCASNDPELQEPEPLDSLLTTRQIRDIVWLALDRDTSLRRLENGKHRTGISYPRKTKVLNTGGLSPICV